MPFLKPEPCIWPENLLELEIPGPDGSPMAPSDSLDSPQLTFPAAISEPNDGISEPNDGISEPNYAIAEPDSEESFSAESAIGLPVTNEQDENARKWWAVYTKPRFEKKLMRQLFESQVPFYGPMISRRFRSPNGKLRLSIEPLFPNYVFIHGTEMQRYTAICTGSVSRWMPVANPYELVTDLRQIHNLILTDAPLAPELRLQPGQKVRVRSGVFKGFEGVILRRENQVRLLIAVRYMGRGASVALDDCQLEPI